MIENIGDWEEKIPDKYRRLKRAIIVQAMRDYKIALKMIMENPYSRYARALKKDCETFFKSEWFYTLTGTTGFPLMMRIRKSIMGTDKMRDVEWKEYHELQHIIHEGDKRREPKGIDPEILAVINGRIMDYE